jgi:bifunctional non-homologous end joining protein LigD
VQPKLVAQIEFLEWTSGDLRHSKFAGLRGDKDAAEVRKKRPLPTIRNEKALNPSHEEQDDHN